MHQREEGMNKEYFQALQHSFFKKFDDSQSVPLRCPLVKDFEVGEENPLSGSKSLNKQSDHIADYYQKAGENLLSTRSTKKSDNMTCKGSYMAGSTSDYLFSGFFGQRHEERADPTCHNSFSVTKPFPMAEEERRTTNKDSSGNFGSNFDFCTSKSTIKKAKANEEIFNGSFLNSFSQNRSGKTQPNFNTNASTCSNSFNDLVKSVSLSNFKKKKILSSEELLIEKLKKEKEEMQRLRSTNSLYAEKVKTFAPKPINPAPLTLIKPFNLSSNNPKMLTKKRTANANIDEINSKISETIRRKCEGVTAMETIRLQKTPPNVRYMKKPLGRSKSPLRTEEDVQSLSSRIEKYCVISGTRPNKSKSPVKNLFNGEGVFGMHVSNILNTSKNSGNGLGNVYSSSIRKHFGTPQMTTEEKREQEMKNYKFKAKPLNKHVFTKKTPEIESFENILQKTRMEKESIQRGEKEEKRMNKIAEIKNSKFTRTVCPNYKNKENSKMSDE